MVLITKQISMSLNFPEVNHPFQSPGEQKKPRELNEVDSFVIAENAHEIGWNQRGHGQHCKDAIVITEVKCTGKQYLHKGHHYPIGATADEKLFCRYGVGDGDWVGYCVGQGEVDARVVADFNAVYAFYLFLNNQAVSPDQTGQNVKTAEDAAHAQIGHEVMSEIGCGLIARVPQGRDVFSTGCEHHPYTASNYPGDLPPMDRNTVQKRVQYKHTKRSTDIEYIDDGQRDNIVHGCEAYLIDEHGCASGQQPFIISASLEIQVHSHPAQQKIVGDEYSDAPYKVGLYGVVVPLGNVDEAEGVHHGCQEEQQIGEVVPTYLTRDTLDPLLNHFQVSFLVILLGFFFHVII